MPATTPKTTGALCKLKVRVDHDPVHAVVTALQQLLMVAGEFISGFHASRIYRVAIFISSAVPKNLKRSETSRSAVPSDSELKTQDSKSLDSCRWVSLIITS